MCKAKEISQKFVELMDEIGTEYDNLTKAQSVADLTQNDILHYIENNSFSASDGYKLAKAIKDIRQE